MGARVRDPVPPCQNCLFHAYFSLQVVAGTTNMRAVSHKRVTQAPRPGRTAPLTGANNMLANNMHAVPRSVTPRKHRVPGHHVTLGPVVSHSGKYPFVYLVSVSFGESSLPHICCVCYPYYVLESIPTNICLPIYAWEAAGDPHPHLLLIAKMCQPKYVWKADAISPVWIG